MRRWVLAGLVATGLWAATAAGDEPGSLPWLLQDFGLRPLAGEPPALALPGLDGRRHRLEDLRGRVAFLYFWATW
jgi:hypothetical protein